MKRREPDKFFNVILNSIADGVFTTDHDGKITFMNKAAEEITGFTSKEAIGHYCFDVFRADICQSRCALKETLKTKKEIINLPATILKKGGQKVPISISTAKAVSVLILMYGLGLKSSLTEGAGQFFRDHTRGGKGR